MKEILSKVTGFFSDVKIELARVVFPSKNDTLMTTTVVILFVIVFSIVLSLVDSILVNLIKIVI